MLAQFPHEKKQGVEQDNHCRVTEKEKWQGIEALREAQRWNTTQISIFLYVSSSTVRKVTELVRSQIGLDIVLLDSKCYPSWTMTALAVRPSESQHERYWLPTGVFTTS